MPAPDNRKRLSVFVVALALLIATPLTVVAASGFTDVPDSNVFKADIQWLANAGVTKGCNPPANTEFCPSDNVTREQMAAFMHRLAQYIGAEDGTPAQADNADQVDGLDANGISRAGTNGGNTLTQITSTDLGSGANILNSATITMPEDGALLVLWSAWQQCAGTDEAEVQLYVDGVGNDSSFVVLTCAASGDKATASFQNLLPLSKGVHQLEMHARDYTGAPNNLTLGDSRLTVAYIPFDMTGGSAFDTLGTVGATPSGNGPGR